MAKKCPDDFVFGKTLDVLLATEKESGMRYAAKVVPKKHFLMHKLDAEAALREKEILQRCTELQLPGIVSLHYTFQDSWDLYYILSLCEKGNIKEYWKKNESLSHQTKLGWLKSIAKSIAALHSFNILHGDIKPENCILDGDLNVFICDFNVARQLESPTATIPLGLGSASFMSPEATLTGRGLACDVWAFGCLAFELFTNELPFQGTTDWLTIQAVRNNTLSWKSPLLSPEQRNNASDGKLLDPFYVQLSDLISQCLVPCPEDRISASAIVEHPVFSCTF